MSVTEIASAVGEWSLTLKENTPLQILDKLGYFGHIAISGGRVDPALTGDALLADARYVGVLRDRSFGSENKALKGAGMAIWLGDEDDKGEVIEAATPFVNSTFTAALTALLPDAVSVGSISALAGLYNGTHQFQSPRKAIDYICSLYNAEWRVNGNGTLDAGLVSTLYVSEPKAAILRNRSGLELDYRALRGQAKLDSDVKDFTTRVLLLAEGTEATTVSATADINPALNPYLDLFGNPVKRTRVVSEQQTSEGNAGARAQLQLNRFTSPRDALSLSTVNYDVRGDVRAGDYVWVYDPDAKLIDTANAVFFHGEEVYPLKLRLFQMTWPISAGMGVTFRTGAGEWIDLTDYVQWETGDTTLVVGGYNRSLTGVGSGIQEDPGSRPIVNSTTPGVVVWNTPFAQSTYQSEDDGLTRAQIVLDWTQPLNTDSSIITDGFAYEIRWRTSEVAVWPSTHLEMQAYRHDQLGGLFQSPVPFTLGSWQYTQVSWDDNQFLMLDLTPGIPYDFQIRAIDSGTPPNLSEWSSSVTVQTRPDTTAPSSPAPPATVAGSRNAIQVVHTLGRASGGTYNLEADLNHFEIHIGIEPTYLPDPLSLEAGGTMVGKLPANQGMMRGQIPAVGTFQLNDEPDRQRHIKVIAVDNFGNRSGPSEPVTQTAELIDSAFISELTVSKVSAGFIQTPWINASEITTATSGARVAVGWYGIEAYNNNNIRTLQVDAMTGNVNMIGTFQSGVSGRRVAIDGVSNSVRFYPEIGETRFVKMFSYIPPNFPNDIVWEVRGIDSDTADYTGRMYMFPDSWHAIVSPQGTGGDPLSSASLHVEEDGILLTGSKINGTSGSFTETVLATLKVRGIVKATQAVDPQIRLNVYNQSGARNGGFLWLDDGNTGDIYFGRKTPTLDHYIRVTDLGMNFAVNNVNKVQIGVNGIAATTYFGLGSINFRGQINGGAVNDTFSIRDAGGADPILDADGFSARFVKNFVIDHPLFKTKRLVHGCTETPEAAVEYHGIAEVSEYGKLVEVVLPKYFEALTHEADRQVWLQPMLPAATSQSEVKLYPYLPRAAGSYPKNGRFWITTDGGPGTLIAWKVKAVRKDVPQFTVEPSKTGSRVMGAGPYTYLVEN